MINDHFCNLFDVGINDLSCVIKFVFFSIFQCIHVILFYLMKQINFLAVENQKNNYQIICK